MNGTGRKLSRFLLAVFTALLLASVHQVPSAYGETSTPFFQGKMIRIVVGYNTGGGFDTFARLLARHLKHYLPGKPSIIVQNMPGAASLIAANMVYAAQPGDGLTIVTFHFGKVSQAVIGDPVVKFDPRKFIWLGDPAIGGLPEVLWVRSDLQVRSLDDLKKRKEPVHVANTGAGTAPAAAGEFLRYLGLPVKNIYGYKGSRATMAAMERKEVDGRIISQSTMQTVYRRYIEQGLVRPILAIGKEPRLEPLPGVATLEDLKLNSKQRKLADFLEASWTLLRLYAIPPGTPPERSKLLQEAFLKALRSPDLIRDAKRQGVLVHPVSGEEVGRIVQKLLEAPSDVLEEYKKLISPKR